MFAVFWLQLVIFPNAEAMYGIELEGLIAYRSDVKKLYFRDHERWHSIRVSHRETLTQSQMNISTNPSSEFQS